MLMQVMVDGLLVQYEMHGTGEVIVLLHGWGDRASGLKILAGPLSKEYAVLSPDLPGFGGTANPPAVWDLTDYARFIAHLLQKLNISNVYAFVGHSNGGAIAMRGIGRGAFSADRLVLLASAGIRGRYNTRNKAQRLVVKTGKALVMPLPAGLRNKLRHKVYDTIGSDMLVAEHLQETFKKIVTDDVQKDAANITIPTLLMYGEDDRATPVQFGEMFYQLIDGSTLEILAGAGHFLYLDRPNETITTIQEFLR